MELIAGAGLLAWSATAMADPPVDMDVSQGDFNGDGTVDGADWSMLEEWYEKTEADFWCAVDPELGWRAHLGQHHGDANRDGVVDDDDVDIWIEDYEEVDPPIPAITGVAVTSWTTNGLTAYDTYNGKSYVLIDAGDFYDHPDELWRDPTSMPATGLEPSITLDLYNHDYDPPVLRTDGFDLIVVYDNTPADPMDDPKTLGDIDLGTMRFKSNTFHERAFVVTFVF